MGWVYDPTIPDPTQRWYEEGSPPPVNDPEVPKTAKTAGEEDHSDPRVFMGEIADAPVDP